MSHLIHIRIATIKAAVVLTPSYLAADLTDKMVWVVPTLAAASFFAATIGMEPAALRRRVDDDGESDIDTDFETLDTAPSSSHHESHMEGGN